jgi:hypothetical protein
VDVVLLPLVRAIDEKKVHVAGAASAAGLGVGELEVGVDGASSSLFFPALCTK